MLSHLYLRWLVDLHQDGLVLGWVTVRSYTFLTIIVLFVLCCRKVCELFPNVHCVSEQT